jgi:hypothetical protein
MKPEPINPYGELDSKLHVHIQEVDDEEAEEIAELQAHVSRLISRAIIFSVIWVLGAGSLYSVYLAAKAHRYLRENPGKLHGLAGIWWCYLMGGFGVLLVTVILTAILMNG